MGRVTAATVVTQVIDLLLARDVPVEVGVDHQMDGHCLAVEAHPAIATTSAFARVRAFPQEAWGGLLVQYEAGVGYGNTSQDTFDDHLTTFTELVRGNNQRGVCNH